MESIEVDCRICENCDLKNDCCKLYGSDPEKATKSCAEHGFVGYRPINKMKG